jgi:hypothetical protein
MSNGHPVSAEELATLSQLAGHIISLTELEAPCLVYATAIRGLCAPFFFFLVVVCSRTVLSLAVAVAVAVAVAFWRSAVFPSHFQWCVLLSSTYALSLCVCVSVYPSLLLCCAGRQRRASFGWNAASWCHSSRGYSCMVFGCVKQSSRQKENCPR